MTFLYEGRNKKIPEVKYWYPQTVVYDPIKVGSIDCTDIKPHDNGIVRAVNSRYKLNCKIKGHPLHTLFIGRLSLDTTEKDLENEFSRYGKMIALRLVKDIITGLSKRYAFVEYETSKMALNAYRRCKSLVIRNSEVIVDFECERLLPGWKPRRLGGGFGGEKQSGQLRFGGRYRSFKQPFNLVALRNNRTHIMEDKRIKLSTARRPLTTSSYSNSNYVSTTSSYSNSNYVSTTSSYSNSNYVSTTSAPSVISLPLTPPSYSSIVLPLTPPSHSGVLSPSTTPSNSIIVLPLTPPSHSTVTLPLTPPLQPNAHLPLTPPLQPVAPLPLTPPSN